METGIGDRLARGVPSAQFGGAGSAVSDFEQDFVFMDVDALLKKYNISQAEYDRYQVQRENGEKLPDLTSAALQPELDAGFSVSDHRRNYLLEPTKVEVKAAQPKKYPEPSYEPMQTLMDRILVMVISDDPNIELLEDGSSRDKRTGLISTARYRQHSNVGIVLLAGQWVVVSGVKTPMNEIVKPGDKVIYGDYGSEKMPETFNSKAEAICDSIGVNFEKTEQGIRIVRIQDVRTVNRRISTETNENLFAVSFPPSHIWGQSNGTVTTPATEVKNG